MALNRVEKRKKLLKLKIQKVQLIKSIMNTIIALVIPSLTLYNTLKSVKTEKIQEYPKMEIKIEDYNIEDIKRIYYDDNINMKLLYSKNDQQESNIFNEKCVLSILFQNQSPNPITLTNFKYVAEDIVINKKPQILIYDWNSENDIFIEFINNGWGNIDKITGNITNSEELFYQIYNKENLSFNLKNLYPGDKKMFSINGNQSNFSSIKETISISPILNYSLNNNTHVFQHQLGSYLITPEGIKDDSGGKGHGGDLPYIGIIIHTDNTKESYDYKIYQKIPPHESIILNIAVAPDKSCSFNSFLEFEINNSKLIQTDIINLEFFVPYYNGLIKEKSFISGNNIEPLDDEDYKVYFPFKVETQVLKKEDFILLNN